MSTTIAAQRSLTTSLIANRSDLAVIVSSFNTTHPPIDQWIAEAYIDLGSSIDFEDLETGPVLMVAPADNITQYFPLPSDCRGVKQVRIDPGTGRMQALGQSDYNLITRYTPTPGLPSRWARRGYNLWFDRIPDRNYFFDITYWQVPVIKTDATNSNSDIEATTILLPDDWHEILRRAAALRGWHYLEDFNREQQELVALYGDPTDKQHPGIIKIKLLPRVADRVNAEYGIAPRTPRYTY